MIDLEVPKHLQQENIGFPSFVLVCMCATLPNHRGVRFNLFKDHPPSDCLLG